MRIITRDAVERVIKPRELVEEVSRALALYSLGKTTTPPRLVLRIQGNWWGIMTSRIAGMGIAVKLVSVISGNASRGLPPVQGVVLLANEDSGEPLALIDGTVLTAWRTASASIASVIHMASSTDNLAIIGAGFQARYHVRVAADVLSIRRIVVSSRTRSKALDLARFASSMGIDAVVADSNEHAVRLGDVVIASTSSNTPVIAGGALRSGSHVVSIGAHEPGSRELDDEAIRRARVIAVDSREGALNETGDIIEPVRKDIVSRDDLVELGEIIAGLRRGRHGDDDITLFKSVGLAVEDTAAAYYVYSRCMDLCVDVQL
jgi:alanine dehydrogenase